MAGRPSRRVNCDAEGNFSFSQLFPPGRLSLNASLEARQAVVTVDLDGSTATLNQAMTLSGQGSVRARLVTPEGQALPGAEARLISSRTSQVRFTDPDGSVRFDAVPAGDVEVSFQSPNSLVERALWQGTLAAEGQVVDAGDVALEAMAAIVGTLRDESGESVAGEIITLTEKVELATFRRSTDSSGQFRFDALPVGEYELSVYNDITGCRLFRSLSIVDATSDSDLGSIDLDCTAPSLVSTSPIDMESDIPPDGFVELVFSEEVDPLSFAAAVKLLKASKWRTLPRLSDARGSDACVCPKRLHTIPGHE